MTTPKGCVGFTLIELMVTVVVAAIVLTIAVPGFQEVIRINRMATMTNEFVGALNLARSEAIKRGRRVTLCKSANAAAAAPSCVSGGGYQQGWVVFVDANNNGQRDGGEEIIRAYAGFSGAATLIGTAANDVDDYISYTPLGLNRRADGQSATGGALQLGTLTLCEPHSHKARAMALNSLGRVGLTETTC